MPWGLRWFQQARHLHFINFSCYRRRPLLTPAMRRVFERAVERARVKCGFVVTGYVVMPDHVHLLLSEPERDVLATAIKAIKQSVARKVGGRFWEERYYDFNVWSERKRIEKPRTGKQSGTVGVEQLPTLPDGRARCVRNRIPMDRAREGARWDCASVQVKTTDVIRDSAGC